MVLMHNAPPTFHDHVLAVCRAAGFAPKIVQETNELFTMLMLVRAGIREFFRPLR
jgi:hypothetical protein